MILRMRLHVGGGLVSTGWNGQHQDGLVSIIAWSASTGWIGQHQKSWTTASIVSQGVCSSRGIYNYHQSDSMNRERGPLPVLYRSCFVSFFVDIIMIGHLLATPTPNMHAQMHAQYHQH